MIDSSPTGAKPKGLSFSVYRFLVAQVAGIRDSGWRAIRRKVITLLGLALAVIPVLLVRAIRRIVLIRFSGLGGERIGDVTTKVEFYFCERDAGNHPDSLDLFYYASPICNEQVGRMIERKLQVFKWASYLDRVNRFIPGGGKHDVGFTGHSNNDVTELLPRWPIHLGLTKEEEQTGQAALENIGIPYEGTFVCVHVRDSTYLNSAFPGFDSSYHDFRDSRIQNYLPAMETLASKGYFALRMGSVVEEPLDTSSPRIIDYATNHRTDFLDIYLFWRCSFYLGSSAGIWSVPAIFRKPVAFVNYLPVQGRNTRGPHDVLIPKKLWLRNEHRYMTFREIFQSGAGWFRHKEQYDGLGLDLVENSPEEITALAMEMDQRIRGSWQCTKEDEELQERYWSLFGLTESIGLKSPRMGAQFLRENPDLLE